MPNPPTPKKQPCYPTQTPLNPTPRRPSHAEKRRCPNPNARRPRHASRSRALLAGGDWRNGSEKGWLAFRAATAALVWDVTGVHCQTETDINAGLNDLLYQRRGEYDELSKLYSLFTQNLLFDTFYDGVYCEDIPNLIQEVADYIRRAEELAQNDA